MKFIITVLMIGLLISCTKPKRTPYLTYTADSFNVNNVELYRLDKDYTLFDQAEREPESMIWSFRSDSVPGGIYQLRINNKKITLVLEGNMPVGIEMKNGVLTITGNEPTKQLWEAQSIADQLNKSILSLGESFPDSLESSAFVHHKDSIFDLVELQKEKAQKKILQIIDHNKHTLLPLLLVQLKAGNHHLFDYGSDANMYFTVDEYLQSYNPNYNPVRDFSSKVDSLRSWIYYTSVSMPGKVLPDLNVPNAWNDPIPLSRFRGRNTLYIIWNSESKESRKITKNLMSWSRTYRYKGLDLCLISTDVNKEKWQEAIDEDNLPVWHLCDLKGKNSPVLAGLGITEIPTLILVDKEGIILERSSEQADITKHLDQLIQK
nr:thioredoxin-like domain-containing protein [uncultured Carboxylicivirga sp.]